MIETIREADFNLNYYLLTNLNAKHYLLDGSNHLLFEW